MFLLSPRIRANQIQIKKNISSKIPKFCFDRGRIEQVIINLLNNSIDAVREIKEINIDVSIETSDLGKKNVTISIKDQGSGISGEHIDKIFEPFYSTKSTDKGTGLGLSISKAIVKRHKGKIRVESKKNIGTTFIIELPLILDSKLETYA